ncbi:MAG: response regulator [Chloroherpetonaceae bacterium]|nr:response regulator [Chloroherpetonaceae bacterium]
MAPSKRTILIIDDDISILTLFSRALGGAHTIVTKTDGAAALQWLQMGNIVDMILTDLSMPNMDGFEFIKTIRTGGKENRQTPIIVFSSQSDVRVRIRALQLGADDFMQKPVHIEELSLRINNLFRRTSGTRLDV